MNKHRKTDRPYFVLVFATIVVLNGGSGVTAFYLGNQPTLTESQNRILDSTIEMWRMSTLALIGLLGSRYNLSDNKNDFQD